MDSVHLGQAAHAPPVYRMVPPYNFEKLHLPHLLTPVPVRLEAAAGYRLPGVRGWGHFRGSKRPEVGPVQGIVLMSAFYGEVGWDEELATFYARLWREAAEEPLVPAHPEPVVRGGGRLCEGTD